MSDNQPDYHGQQGGGYPPPGYGGYPPPGYGGYGGYPPGGPGWPDPSAPWGRDPVSGEPLSDKSKVVAGLLQLFFGGFGVGRFYMGSNGIAAAQLILTILGFLTLIILIGVVLLGAVAIWALVDGIVILAGQPRDGRGLLLRG